MIAFLLFLILVVLLFGTDGILFLFSIALVAAVFLVVLIAKGA